ncbi:MAG: hypothetical protein ACYDCH_14425 [Gaiellaceae bacterium]
MSTTRSLCLVALCALAAVPAAAGPAPFAAQGGAGVVSRDGAIRFLALPAGTATLLEAVDAGSGTVRHQRSIPGTFGVPILTYNGFGEGLSFDGKTLVVQTMTIAGPTSFRLVDTRTLRTTQTIALKGAFSFDALSPDASRLYLVQRVSRLNIFRYVVRAYDLRSHRLLPGRIADKAQASWVMQGFPATRVTSADGRWVYTLYTNPGGTPFVHALDTVQGVAHCIGLPWSTTDQSPLAGATLSLDGRTLVARLESKPWLRVDTTTWRISTP